MNDRDFLSAALGELSSETVAAASAAAAAQMHLPHRITPGEVMAFADAVGAPRSPVLALMGWISARGDRCRRRLFFDVLCPTLSRHDAIWPTDRETVMALAICRTLRD